ncbi:MAG: DJ-1/PfpI family protein, partial [Prevotellaceae bacterium]|nr:DJ-1/PfpI family protein [Prevotellaceae bacterium]
METVFVFLANGFEEIEAFTAVDVLRRGGLDVQLVSMNSLVDSDTPECVIGAHDVEVVCDVLFAEADFTRAKALVLPGGMPGAEVLSKHNGLNELVTQFFKADKLVAAICAAPMVLGKLGLLQ